MAKPYTESLEAEVHNKEPQKTRGKLKIFFGYAAGVGKTYAMLEDAHILKNEGIDVVIGYVEPHQRPQTSELLEGFEQLPVLEIEYKDITVNEFDIDKALIRRPKLIVVDELAHTNAHGSRHKKRYKDIEELLKAGIDVYTTVNVQHIEGLKDIVQSITGVAVRERVPDDVFNNANKVELVDIEPDDLIIRLNEGKIYKDAKQALSNFFIKENLIALREIALRKMADKVNISVNKNKRLQGGSTYFTEDHVMMCLSSSPSNAKVIRTAAKMAEAFHGTFTALFVETSDVMSENNEARLGENLRLAEQLGAKIVTVYGDDVAYQVAEYAKISSVSKIVIGRPASRGVFKNQNYVDKLTAYAPNLEVYVIPNEINTSVHKSIKLKLKSISFGLSDTIKSILCLVVATLIGVLFQALEFSDANIITVYILATLITAVITERKIYSLISSILAVLLFNYFFTSPIFSLNTYNSGYPVTFLIMFLSALITSTFTKKVKEQAKQASQKAYRTEVLLETSQKLQQAKNSDQIFYECASQLRKLLAKTIVLYPIKEKTLSTPITFCDENVDMKQYLASNEFATALWVYNNNKHAGATTNTLPGSKCLYMAVRTEETVFAVVGVAMNETQKLESFEKSILLTILSDCAIALEKESILKTKNEIVIKANREKLRSNLLRAISHDLRTPLTGIAGGAGFLEESWEKLDAETVKSILLDIYTEAMWLSGLVENLLNMTRIQDGRLEVNKKSEVLDEVVSEAIAKVSKRSTKHTIEITKPEKLIFVPMDAQLIMQVIINLLDNAFRHTKENSNIVIKYYVKNSNLILLISDNGGGIPEDRIDKIFEPFFTLSQSKGDTQRGMGLGLNICKSIIEAHEGKISVKNNNVGGATFYISLPMS